MARLIHEERLTDWAVTVVRSLISAQDQMAATVGASLTAAGLDWSTPVDEVGAASLWDQARWTRIVTATLEPTAHQVATDMLRHLRASVPRRAHAGMTDPRAAMVAVVTGRAVSFGPTVARRITRNTTLSIAAAGVDLDAIRAMIDAAPTRRGGRSTVADAYQQAYAQLDQLVGSATSAMGQAGVAAIGEAAADNIGAQVTHTWQCSFVEHSRETHMDADGQVQNAGDPFDVGDEQAMYPGDPDLSDGEACNCLCWLETEGIDQAVDDSAVA